MAKRAQHAVTNNVAKLCDRLTPGLKIRRRKPTKLHDQRQFYHTFVVKINSSRGKKLQLFWIPGSTLGSISFALSSPVVLAVLGGTFPNSNKNNNLCCTRSCKLQHILRAAGHMPCEQRSLRSSYSSLI